MWLSGYNIFVKKTQNWLIGSKYIVYIMKFTNNKKSEI